MDRDRLVLYLAAVFAGLTVLLAVVALAKQPFLLVLALPFGATTYFLWFHATGRLAERTRRRARQERARTQAARDAGPRAERDRFGERTRRRAQQTADGQQRRSTTPGRGAPGPTREEAYRTLDLEPGASGDAVRRAYRRKVKEVHPDTDSGDEEAFRRVNRAYETLTD